MNMQTYNETEMGQIQTTATRNMIYKVCGKEIKMLDLKYIKILQMAGSIIWLSHTQLENEGKLSSPGGSLIRERWGDLWNLGK